MLIKELEAPAGRIGSLNSYYDNFKDVKMVKFFKCLWKETNKNFKNIIIFLYPNPSPNPNPNRN